MRRKLRHWAGYPPVRPASWPGRQYTNLAGMPQAPLLQKKRHFECEGTPLMRVREIITGEGLLQAELDGHGQVHGHGFAVERCGLGFPPFQSVHSCLMQQRGPGNDLNNVNPSVSI